MKKCDGSDTFKVMDIALFAVREFICLIIPVIELELSNNSLTE